MRRRGFLQLFGIAPAVAVAEPQGFFGWLKGLFTPRPNPVGPLIPAAAWIRLFKNKLSVARSFNVDFSKEFGGAKIGDTIKIRKPVRWKDEA
jgi:hypothetical protein